LEGACAWILTNLGGDYIKTRLPAAPRAPRAQTRCPVQSASERKQIMRTRQILLTRGSFEFNVERPLMSWLSRKHSQDMLLTATLHGTAERQPGGNSRVLVLIHHSSQSIGCWNIARLSCRITGSQGRQSGGVAQHCEEHIGHRQTCEGESPGIRLLQLGAKSV
jgi:hypothetical protein